VRRKLTLSRPGPLQRDDADLLIGQLDALLKCQPPLWNAPGVMYDQSIVAMAQLQSSADFTMLINALQNIAQALLRLRHYELALAYALAAVRLQVHPSQKSLYRAAFAAAHVGHSMSSLYLLQLVRGCKPRLRYSCHCYTACATWALHALSLAYSSYRHNHLATCCAPMRGHHAVHKVRQLDPEACMQAPVEHRDDAYHALRQVVEREMAPIWGKDDLARSLETHTSRGKTELAGILSAVMPHYTAHLEVRLWGPA
jgi:hypothetical protein